MLSKRLPEMDEKKNYDVNIDQYCFIPRELRETIKIKLESSEKRWDDIIEIIKKNRETNKSE